MLGWASFTGHWACLVGARRWLRRHQGNGDSNQAFVWDIKTTCPTIQGHKASFQVIVLEIKATCSRNQGNRHWFARGCIIFSMRTTSGEIKTSWLVFRSSFKKPRPQKASFQVIGLKIKATSLASRSSFKISKQQVWIIKATRLVFRSSWFTW